MKAFIKKLLIQTLYMHMIVYVGFGLAILPTYHVLALFGDVSKYSNDVYTDFGASVLMCYALYGVYKIVKGAKEGWAQGLIDAAK